MGRGISIRPITAKCRGNIHNSFRKNHKPIEVKARRIELKQMSMEAKAANIQASNTKGANFTAIA